MGFYGCGYANMRTNVAFGDKDSSMCTSLLFARTERRRELKSLNSLILFVACAS